MADTPIRMTKTRAHVLIDLAQRGIEEVQASIESEYGIRFDPDGQIGDIDVADLLMENPDAVENLGHRLQWLAEGFAALDIFTNRYT